MRKTLLIAFAVLSTAALAEDGPYQPVDAADLGIGARKYEGKNVIVRGSSCYYADVADYRCKLGDAVVVFTTTIEPEASKRWIEDHCDTIKKASTSSACTGSIKFKFENVRQDVMSGYQYRTVISPAKIVIDLPSPATKRR